MGNATNKTNPPFSTEPLLPAARPARRQIAEQLRQKIKTGELDDGQKLPPTSELAQSWGVDKATAQWALARLAEEGLLKRTPRVGTFVRRPTRLETVAIYAPSVSLTTNHSPFRAALVEAIRRRLSAAGTRSELYLDVRPEAKQAEAWDRLTEATNRREVQAAIGIAGDPEHNRWFHKLKVPTASLGGPPLNSVNVNSRQLFELALRELSRLGCRDICVINAVHRDRDDYYVHLVDTAGALGLSIRNEHVLCPPPLHRLGCRAQPLWL